MSNAKSPSAEVFETEVLIIGGGVTGTGVMRDLALRGIKPGINRGKLDLNMLKACGLQDNQGGILRAIEELENLSKRDGWLIIFTHDVREQPSPWGVTLEDYDLLLSAIYASGADVVTVGDMVRRIKGDLAAPQKLAA